MKMLATKMAIATSVALAALLSSGAADARKYRAAPKPYDARQSWPSGSRFTPEQQRIIDSITENDWRNGK